MTPAQIIRQVRNQINETAPRFWSQLELYDYLWSAEILISNVTNGTEARDTSITTVAGTMEYTRPADINNIKGVYWQNWPLKKLDRKELDTMIGPKYQDSITRQSRPSYYVEFADQILLYPIPNDAKTLEFWYVKQPTLKTDTSTSFDIEQQFAPYLVDYVAYRAFIKSGENQRAGDAQNRWELNLKKAKKEWSERQGLGRFRQVKRQEDSVEVDAFNEGGGLNSIFRK